MVHRFRISVPALILLVAVIAAVIATACDRTATQDSEPLPVENIERIYLQTRDLKDEIGVTRSRGSVNELADEDLATQIERYNAVRLELQQALAASSASAASEQDRRALEVMRTTFHRDLGGETIAPASADAEVGRPPDCAYDPDAIASDQDGYRALSERMYACFSEAAHSLSFEGEALDRLTIFGLLPLTDDPVRREALWLALEPLWKSVNGDGSPRSPYRTLVRMNAARLKREGRTLGESVRSIGVEPAVMEEWLMSVLQRWHDITPDTPIDPWDFTYGAGRANRALRQAIPLESLRPVNDRFYRDLGADPGPLLVRYDLEPRASKDPVAFTTFGRRPRVVDGRVVLGEPWVFASYQIGGLDNLLELLHETGHAIHIAAIRTRPAFADWPDSDIFTEGIADIATMEMYEPAWQERYLGASVPLEDSIAAKYAGIVMDTAWALFEIRIHRAPERDPNEVWTEITSEYFRIGPHSDRAWWAVRGQLIDSPGYMMNYAAGAIMNADLRARARALNGSYTNGDPDWYGRIADRLYRFGLERSSVEVIEEFLGRPVSQQALLDDMARALGSADRGGMSLGPDR